MRHATRQTTPRLLDLRRYHPSLVGCHASYRCVILCAILCALCVDVPAEEIGTEAASAPASESTALPPSFVWERVPGLKWRTTGAATISNGILEVSLPEVGNGYAEADIDLSGYDGRPFEISATVETWGVADAEKNYLGFRFAVNYLDMTAGGGNRTWPSGPSIRGDFGPGEVVFADRFEKERRVARLQIGICHARGRMSCDLSTIRIREPQPLVEPRNRDYRVSYPERVVKMPRMRGAVLGGNMDGDAWDVLQGWGATLVRHQMSVNGAPDIRDFEGYATGFRENAEKAIDNAVRTLDAAAAHGMKVVLDAHFAPGGRCGAGQDIPVAWDGDHRMFHDKRFADLMLWFWKQVAERCSDRREAIYGYDLMNEVSHHSPAIPGGDIVGLQERIGKAIRAIDPDTPIIVESMHADPGWFRSLYPIDLDNVIYSVHLYYPHDYTHQGILTPIDEVYEWPDEKRGWNRGFLRKSLEPVIDFQRRHGAKIFVGEFSAIAWAPGAETYIGDCISLFEELGWDWTYHAFREFPGWSVEHEAVSRGRKDDNFRKTEDNPRMRVLLRGLRGGDPGFRLYAQTLEARFATKADASAATISFRPLPPGMVMSLTARGDDTTHRHLAHARALSAAGAKSTYYVNGLSPDYAEKILRPILALGHSIGAHTRTHHCLSSLNANGIFDEILGNRIDIESAADTCVSTFTLPFCDRGNRANPKAQATIGESLCRAGLYGGGDILEDPAAAYGLPPDAIVGCLRYDYDDRHPSQELFAKEIRMVAERIRAGNLPPCGPHVVMGMHSLADDAGMAELTRCFETQTGNPDAPFAGRTWFCNENESVAAWMQSRHTRIAGAEREGDCVRWTILRPEPSEIGADVPLFVAFGSRPVSIRLDGVALPPPESAESALPNATLHRIPARIEHLPPTRGDPGDESSSVVQMTPSEKFPGVSALLQVSPSRGDAVLHLRNGGAAPLRQLRATLRLPPAFSPQAIPEGRLLPETLASGETVRAAFRLERLNHVPWFADGPTLFDAELDFELGEEAAGRLHVTHRVIAPRTPDPASIRDCARAAAPLPASEWPAERVAALSRPGATLDGLRLFPLKAPPSCAPCTYRFDSGHPEAKALVDAIPEEFRKDFLNLIVVDFIATGRDATISVNNPASLYVNGRKCEFRNDAAIRTLAGRNRLVLTNPANSWRKEGVLAFFESGSEAPCAWSPPAP